MPKNYIAVIQSQLPELDIQSYELEEYGQFNTVLKVNDSLIFRFPRYEEGRNQLQTETSLLKALQGKTSLPVPNPIYSHLEAEIGQAFMGYEMIQGEMVNIYTLKEHYDSDVCDALAQQLVDFLQSLHSIPLNAMPVLPDTLDKSTWEDLYHRIKTKLFDKMRPDAREEVSKHFEDFLSLETDYKPCLIHGDFGTGNILFDTETQRFIGVIDFGFINIADPAIDYAALYGFKARGAKFFQHIKQHNPEIEEMLPRIQFFAGTFALYEALHGIENDDAEALEAGLETYI